MSFYRTSFNTIPDNSMHNLRNREYSLDKVNNQINTGKKHRMPREGVIDVTQAMTFHTKMDKIDQLQKNITEIKNESALSEVKMMDAINVMQRVRELTVQSANGIYSEDERKNMAIEVDQLLREVITSANGKYKGNFLFSGHKKYTKPFEVLEGAVRGVNQAFITEVRYLGDNGEHLREVDMGENVAAVKPGSQIFWAEQFQVHSDVNTADFRLTQDTSVLIDNTEIKFNAGDNIYAITDKINQSAAAVKAEVNIITGGLEIKSTVPHKVELSDIKGGTLLQDLGILEEGFAVGPDNYSSDATIFSGSVFDVLIGIRDSMLQNNQEDLGGKHLGAIDNALNNLTSNIAEVGAVNNRMDYLEIRHGDDKMRYTEALSKAEDVDMVDAVSELKLWTNGLQKIMREERLRRKSQM